MEGGIEIRRRQLVRHAERVEIGREMTTGTVGGDELEHGSLFLRHCIADRSGWRKRGGRTAIEFLRLLDAGDRIRMWHVPGFAAIESVEVFTPFRSNRIRVAQITFVPVLDESGVAAGKLGRCRKLLEKTRAHAGLPI